MTWRYQLAQRLAFVSLITSVVMMVLLPWSREKHKSETSDPEAEK
jgi:hypothetical protein